MACSGSCAGCMRDGIMKLPLLGVAALVVYASHHLSSRSPPEAPAVDDARTLLSSLEDMPWEPDAGDNATAAAAAAPPRRRLLVPSTAREVAAASTLPRFSVQMSGYGLERVDQMARYMHLLSRSPNVRRARRARHVIGGGRRRHSTRAVGGWGSV